MSKKKIDPKDNSANQQNPNEGTSGNNEQYLAAEKNRLKQLEEQKKKKEQ